MNYGNRTWQAPADAAPAGGDEGPAADENQPPPRDASAETDAPLDWEAVMDAFAAMDEDKRAIALYQMDTTARMARGVLDSAPGERPGAYDAALRQARAMGMPVGELPPDYDPSVDPQLEQYVEVAQAFLDRAGDSDKQE